MNPELKNFYKSIRKTLKTNGKRLEKGSAQKRISERPINDERFFDVIGPRKCKFKPQGDATPSGTATLKDGHCAKGRRGGQQPDSHALTGAESGTTVLHGVG